MHILGAMITRGEPTLRAAIKSLHGLVDSVHLVCDVHDRDAVEDQIAGSPGSTGDDVLQIFVSTQDWKDDFSLARNASFAPANDLVFWMDSDDTLEGSDHLREYVSSLRTDQPICVALPYEYMHDAKRKCIFRQIQPRVTAARLGVWKGKIHERYALLGPHRSSIFTGAKIIHGVQEPKDFADKVLRNFRLISAALVEDPADVHLLRAYISTAALMGNYAEAKSAAERLFRVASIGWQKHAAALYMSSIAYSKGDYEESLFYASAALACVPRSLEARIALVNNAFQLKRFDDVFMWYGAKDLVTDPSGHNPQIKEIDPGILCCSALQLGRLNLARRYIGRVSADLAETVKHEIRKRDAAKEYFAAKKRGDHEATEHAWFQCGDVPAVIRSRLTKCNPEDYVFLMPPDIQDCHPANLNTGIGGSEEAMILLTRELAAAGKHVEVFGPENLVDHGVHWHDFRAFTRDHLGGAKCIVWRNVELLPAAGHMSYYWAHDMPDERSGPWLTKYWPTVIALSAFQRDKYREIYDGPIRLLSNGIPDYQASKTPTHMRQHSVIYASSPDRGLKRVLDTWPEIQERDPEATLHIYYGFTPLWKTCEGHSKRHVTLRSRILKMIQTLPGVVYHGRVGHKELTAAFESAKVWYYPTDFEEISCITAMRAQAAGSWPVVSSVGALKETVSWGDIMDPEDPSMIDTVVRRLSQTKSFGPPPQIKTWPVVVQDWLTL